MSLQIRHLVALPKRRPELMPQSVLKLAVLSVLAIKAIWAISPSTSKLNGTVKESPVTTGLPTESSSPTSKYSNEHSPLFLPVYAQIIILHLIAALLAIFFYLMRQFVIARLNQRSVVIPNLRMTHRRKRKSSGTKATSSSALKRRLKEAREAQAKEARVKQAS